mmetsp:Transcript_61670/g.182194  ORF Transcript_61670/g.182194 Transcript_61670/m.182194 type:complete len:236 (-) Transcript_61670:69-776(-)|eukprot:CAMPEP_0113546114 /NCGR_PEP_ID=MMETSP0015_2-20120614/11630_1 /TAXON_ID=2838 /ORGANISM="Odontella" /LENGTH=235 /DNA_ID=CAMNT_0000446541 /DNA_START=41 /DNA_END=748 /DNA_ORIENTATION=+ /assembly_acc=CAM_ASM_000160
MTKLTLFLAAAATSSSSSWPRAEASSYLHSNAFGLPMKIRDASHSDISSIRSLLTNARLPSLDDEDVPNFLVAEETGTKPRIIGCGQIKSIFRSQQCEWYELASLCIDPSVRSKGIGSILTKKLLANARDSGDGKKLMFVALMTSCSRLSFYEQFGFKEVLIVEKASNAGGEDGESETELCVPKAMRTTVLSSQKYFKDRLANINETDPSYERLKNVRVVCMSIKLENVKKEEVH